MIEPGLVSITFRKKTPLEVIDLVRQASLRSIEWGGDVHVPHGDTVRATEVRRATEDAGLAVAAYGSYYRVGMPEQPALEGVLETAVALGAPTVRMWAGKGASADTDPSDRTRIVEEALRAAEAAKEMALSISFEYHGNTLTDTNDSVKVFYEECDHPNIKSYWQPHNGKEPAYCLEGLRTVLPRLSNVHVFHWVTGRKDQTALSEGMHPWREYFKLIRSAEGTHHALLEFVKDDDQNQFLEDAETLHRLIRNES